MRYKIILLFLAFNLVFPIAVFSQTPSPENLKDLKDTGEKTVDAVKKELPGTVEKIWREEVWPIWKKMGEWLLKNVGEPVAVWFKKNIEPRIKKEVETKKPQIKEEFQKEKKELKDEAPKVGNSLWQRFKSIIK